MNFDFTDDQHAIKRTARELLADRIPLEAVRELAEGGRYGDGLWDELRELGWPGIFIGEEHGGQGLGAVELAVLAEELGYALAPLPFLSNAAAGLALQHAGSEEQRRRWLPGIASGEAPGTLAVVDPDGRLGGGAPAGREAGLVPDARAAAVIVVVDGASAWLVERADADVEPVDAIDATRRFARVRSDGGDPLPGAADAGVDRACAALAAELTGVSQRAMEMAVEYARERTQFDRPIGAYQAVSHRCAQMLLETEGARSASYHAAWAADAEPGTLARAASMAKAYASDAGWRVAASSLQVHGGIGFTWEHDLHFLMKRARVDGVLYGSARAHRERIAGPRAGAAVGVAP